MWLSYYKHGANARPFFLQKFAKNSNIERKAMSLIVYRGVHDRIRRGFREAEFLMAGI